MSKRANPTVIGAFVVGAVVLVIAAVGVLGSGRFFRKVYPAVLFFEGDVNGLRIGAPVKFKGIQLGEVTSILLRLGDGAGAPEGKETQLIPVLISLDQANIVARGSTVRPDRETLAEFVKRGMRGQLKMESFVTGVLYVELEMHPGTPAEFRGGPDLEYPEIPTLPTAMAEVQAKAGAFLAKLDKVDIDGLVNSFKAAAESFDRLASSPGLHATLDGLPTTVKKVDEAADQLQRTLVSVEGTSDRLKADVVPRVDEALVAARDTLRSVQAVVEPGSPVVYQLGRTLDQVAQAAAAVNRLAAELERNPSMLVRGKAVEESAR
jgi:paraquat-inducible protein B